MLEFYNFPHPGILQNGTFAAFLRASYDFEPHVVCTEHDGWLGPADLLAQTFARGCFTDSQRRVAALPHKIATLWRAV